MGKELISLTATGVSVEFWTRRVSDVLTQLVSDARFEGHFAYMFEIEHDEIGKRIFREGHTCLNFQRHAERIGRGTVPLSAVLYVDGTSYLTNGSSRPFYSKFSTYIS